MTDWVRLWHDMPTDPKWRVIARKSGQPLPCVIAVFTLMLTNASGNANERGVLLGWDHEDAGAALDLDSSDVASIFDAMQGKVLDGHRLTGWERRQPKREDSGVGARVAKHRETKANAEKRDVTHGNAPEQSREDTETDSSVAKATGTVVPLVDPDKHFWDTAKTYLKPHVKGDPGALIGKWSRDFGKIETGQALTAAQIERPVQPVPFIEATLRKRTSNGYGPGHSGIPL